MSQVIRKYSSGKPIKLDDSKLFQRDGFGTYKREDIANQLLRNLEQNIIDEKMNESDAQYYRQLIGEAAQGIKDGRITKMDAQGIHNTMNWNSSGKTEGKKFLGINVGGQRGFEKSAKTNDSRNNALNAFNRYFTKTLDNMSTYNYENELKAYNEKNPKQKYNANTFFTDAISREWYGGNGIDWDNFSKNRTEEDRINLLNSIINKTDFNELFNRHDWSGTNIKSAQDIANLYRTLGSNLSNRTLDNNDYNAFAALGGKNLDQFITGTKPVEQATQGTQGQIGRVDTTWNNPDYDRTIDDKGQYHIYKKDTGEEVSGILPGNVFEGVGNKYAFDGNIYDDSNLPEKYRQDIDRARQAQLGNYTQLTENNPFTKMLKGQGYNYITNLSQFASGLGDNVLYGIYSNPSDINGKMGYYLKNPTTGKAINGKIEYNNSLGQYQFIGNNGTVTNLGTYNKNGTLTNQGTDFVNYNDTSERNLNKLITAWSRNEELNNPASDAYKMVQNTLSRWIMSGNSPFTYRDGQYEWTQGDSFMLARRNPNGQWSWSFNGPFAQKNAQGNPTQSVQGGTQSSTLSQADLNRLRYLINNMGRSLTQNDWEELRQLKNQRIQELRNIPESQRTQQEKDEYYNLTSFKNGGVISAQLGVKFTKVDDPSTITEIPEASPEQKEKTKLVDTSFKRQQNINLGSLFGDKPYGENKKTIDAGGILKDSDKLKLKAALVDLAGTGLGFIPGMNIASAVTGAGASVTNFVADWDDGFQWGDVGNLAMNLGMDALSLIPVGKSAKALRALGTISKSAPLIMTALNAMGLADPELRASYASTLNKIKNINKIDSLKSLNTGDIQNLSAMLGMVLGGKNLAKSRKGFWNTNTTDSGKRRVTAMIDGKQQSLEVDEAFFQNTKGKNQVQELKNKFAEQYNKQNKLEGDKAIKPENVAVDTKYFGRRPQSEKVKGTKGENNWATNNRVGRYFLGYEDPSIPKGLDAYILGYKSKPNKQPELNSVPSIKSDKPTVYTNAGNTLENLANANKMAKTFSNVQDKNFLGLPYYVTAVPKAKLQPGEYKVVLTTGDTKTKRIAPSTPLTGRKPVIESIKTEPNAKDISVANSLNKVLNIIPDIHSNMLKNKANEQVNRSTIRPTPKRLDQFIEDQIPGGIVHGSARKKLEQEYKDIFYPAVEQDQNKLWRRFTSTLQHDINQRKVREADANRIAQRQSAARTREQVNKQIALAVAEASNKKPLTREERSNKQTMYNQLFNQRYYDMQEALRNRELPHKKSNKKKKTSKDNKVKRREWGGLIFKDGGLIPKFENPAGPIRMQAKSKNYFDRNAGLSGYNFGADIDEFLKHGTAEDYVIGFNGREDNYDSLVKASGGTYGNRNYITNPLATTVQSAMLTYNPGYDKYIRQNIQGYGVTEGQTTGTDTYFGDRTWERTLGRNITPEQAKYFNKTYLNQRGMELFDKGDGGFRLRLISPTNQTPENNAKVSTQSSELSNSNSSNLDTDVVGMSNQPTKNSKNKFSLYPEDVLSLGRMLGGLVTNNKVAKLYKTRSLQTTVPDKTEVLHGDVISKAQANKYANDLQNLANRDTTSDSQQQFAKQLEAKLKGISINMQGDAKDASEWFRTRNLVQQTNNENLFRRFANANENSARALATETANKQIDASKVSANYSQVIAPFLAGIENKYNQNRAVLNQIQLESALNNQKSSYQAELSSLYDKYKDNIPELTKQKQLLDDKYKQLILNERKSLVSNPWLINFAKSGSKLGYKEKAALQRAKDFNKRLLEDNKRFHKDIMESKKEHNKLLKHMSSLTAALIKKGLNL